MIFDSEVDEPEGDVENFLDPKLDESLESDVGRNVVQIMDSDSNSENGNNMEQTEDPKSGKKETLDFQLAREAFESIGISLPSLEFDILQTGLTSLIGVRNGFYDSAITKKVFCNILQMENAGRQSVGRRRLVFIKKLASCFHEFPIPSCNLFVTSKKRNHEFTNPHEFKVLQKDQRAF